MEQNIYDLIQAIGKVAEQAGMTAKEFSNYLEALALSQIVDNRLCGHAEGASSVASGHYSHAEGAQTIGYNACSRIEGYRNCDGNAEVLEAKENVLYKFKNEEYIEKVEEWSWLDKDDTNE